jgi:hypothetical protein
MPYKLNSIEKEIKILFENKPELRDDNKELCWYYWTEVQHWNPAKHNHDYWHRYCTSPETIYRASRKVQERYSWLRGKDYDRRKQQSFFIAEDHSNR